MSAPALRQAWIPSQTRYAAPAQRRTSNNTAAFLTTQLKPQAMHVSSTAVPTVAPATAVSPARTPWLAPVAITKVTIGPGTMIKTAVIRRKAANSSQFMELSNRRHFLCHHLIWECPAVIAPPTASVPFFRP